MCRLIVAYKRPELFRPLLGLSARDGNIHGTGVARFDNDEAKTWFIKDGVDSMKFLVANPLDKFTQNILWGHTRVASAVYRAGTFKPSKDAAHPHAFGGKTVMHNGMFKEYLLVKNTYGLKSKTDSAIFAELLDKEAESVGVPEIVSALTKMGEAEYSLLVGDSATKTLHIVRGNRLLHRAIFADGSWILNTARENLVDTITMAGLFGVELPELDKIEMISPWVVLSVNNDGQITETKITELKDVTVPVKKPYIYKPAQTRDQHDFSQVYGYGTANYQAKFNNEQWGIAKDRALVILELVEEFPEITLEELNLLSMELFKAKIFHPWMKTLDKEDFSAALRCVKRSTPDLERKESIWKEFCRIFGIVKGRELIHEIYPAYQIPHWVNDTRFYDFLEEKIEEDNWPVSNKTAIN